MHCADLSSYHRLKQYFSSVEGFDLSYKCVEILLNTGVCLISATVSPALLHSKQVYLGSLTATVYFSVTNTPQSCDAILYFQRVKIGYCVI